MQPLPPPPPRSISRPDKRSTDTELRMPTPPAIAKCFSRLARLRCPHCGKGQVMNWKGSIPKRCASCNLRFERSDENYWGGAMFFGYLFGAFIFALTFLAVIVAMWPNVPWDTMQWAIPVGMGLFMLIWIPFSRALYLSIDVMVRPVQPNELL